MQRSKAEEKRDKILNESIIKTMLTLAWPVMIGNVLRTAYNLADTFWLGKVSKEAVAAPGTAWPIIFTFLAIGMGMATAGVSLVSQHTGAGGREKANKAAGQVFGFLLIISVITGIAGFIGSGWVLRNVIDTPAGIYPYALSYLRIIFAGLPFMFMFVSFRFLLRGTGDMKTPMYIMGLGVALNVILDPFLILGIGPLPRLEVAGAAIATVSTRGLASLIGVYLMFNDKVHISLSLGDLRPKLKWIKKIVDIGGPATISRAGSALGFVVLVRLITHFGTVPMSSYSVGRRVIQVINIGIWGFASSVLTMVGQNVGADQHERAEEIVKKAILVSGAIMITISIGVFLIRDSVIQIFINNEAVINEGSRFIAIFVASIPFFGWFRVFNSTYRATGHTKPAMILSLIRIWVLRIGGSYLLSRTIFGYGLGLGIMGVWTGMAASNILITIVSYFYFRTGKWKEKTIEDEEEKEENIEEQKIQEEEEIED